MIRINMIQQDTRHPKKRLRHYGRAWCEVDGRRFETEGPAPIYKLATLLWLSGHGGSRVPPEARTRPSESGAAPKSQNRA